RRAAARTGSRVHRRFQGYTRGTDGRDSARPVARADCRAKVRSGRNGRAILRRSANQGRSPRRNGHCEIAGSSLEIRLLLQRHRKRSQGARSCARADRGWVAVCASSVDMKDALKEWQMGNWTDGYWMSDEGLRLHYRDYPASESAADYPPIICIP